MVKCIACGEINVDSAKFCAYCGGTLAVSGSDPADRAVSRAEADFKRDVLAGLDRSNISYICTVCGTVNGIDTPACPSCGKVRPRAEYIAALRRLQEGKYRADDKKKEIQQPSQIVQVAAPVEHKAPSAAELHKWIPNNAVGTATGQFTVKADGKVYTQPFIIVPYVDQAYPLLQYNPRQVYKYVPDKGPASAPAAPNAAPASVPVPALAPESVAYVPKTAPAKRKVNAFALVVLILALLFAAVVLVPVLTDALDSVLKLNTLNDKALTGGTYLDGFNELVPTIGKDGFDQAVFVEHAVLVFATLFALVIVLASIFRFKKIGLGLLVRIMSALTLALTSMFMFIAYRNEMIEMGTYIIAVLALAIFAIAFLVQSEKKQKKQKTDAAAPVETTATEGI